MLILCSGRDSPPFPQTGGFGVDKPVSGTDSALEADAIVQSQVQVRSDFASISPSRGMLDWPWEDRESLACLPVIQSLCHQEAFSH